MNKIKVTTPFRPIYPSPAGLIVSCDADGRANIMTAGEIFNVGLKNPCIIGIAIREATYTHSLITRNKQFTVNLPTCAILGAVDQIGTISGRDGLDKFAEYGLTAVPSHEVAPPIIAECPVNLECNMLSITRAGDHDLILGEVAAMHVDEDKLDENQKVLIDKVDGFLFAEWGYYRFGDMIKSIGYTRDREFIRKRN